MKKYFFSLYNPFPRILVTIAILTGAVLIIWLLRLILLPFIFAFIVAYFIHPSLTTLTSRQIFPSWVYILFTYIILSFCFIFFLLILTPPLMNDIYNFSKDEQPGLEFILGNKWLDILKKEAGDFISSLPLITSQRSSLHLTLSSSIGSIHLWDIIGYPILVFFISFYMYLDRDKLLKVLKDICPIKIQIHFREHLEEFNSLFSGPIRSHILLSFLSFLIVIPGLIIFSSPYIYFLSFLALIFFLIPSFGIPIFTIFAIGVSYYEGLWGILIWMLGVQILYTTVKLKIVQFPKPHPMLTMFALIAGYNIGGIKGLLFAGPIFPILIAAGRFIYRSIIRTLEYVSSPVDLNLCLEDTYNQIFELEREEFLSESLNITESDPIFLEEPTEEYNKLASYQFPSIEIPSVIAVPKDSPIVTQENNIVVQDNNIADLWLSPEIKDDNEGFYWSLQERECALGLIGREEEEVFADLPVWLQGNITTSTEREPIEFSLDPTSNSISVSLPKSDAFPRELTGIVISPEEKDNPGSEETSKE